MNPPVITHDATGWTITVGETVVTARTAQAMATHLAYWIEACAKLRGELADTLDEPPLDPPINGTHSRQDQRSPKKGV